MPDSRSKCPKDIPKIGRDAWAEMELHGHAPELHPYEDAIRCRICGELRSNAQLVAKDPFGYCPILGIP